MDLLLGWEVFKLGPLFIPLPDYWALRLEGPVDLVGVSFGGYLVARYAAGRPEAEVFDYWAPHSYEIYFLGPEIADQVAYQVGLLQRALPDRPRPVVIEEFGLFEDPQFPEPMRAAAKRARKAGWRIRHTGSGHLKWTSPSGEKEAS